MRRTAWGSCAAALALLVASCGEGPTEPGDVSFAASLEIDLSQMTRTDTGVYIQTVTPGTGERRLTPANHYSMDYILWLPDGTRLDQGTVRTEVTPSFIPGWEIGVQGMRVGEVRKLVIPSRLAYGEAGLGAVPPNSVLVFQVSLAALR